MELGHLKALLDILTAAGVTHYRNGDLELHLEQAGAVAPQPVFEEPDPRKALLGDRFQFPGRSRT